MRIPALAFATALLLSPVHAQASDDPWPGLVTDVFNDRPMQEQQSVIAIEAPYRAEDAAIVPITLKLAPPSSPGKAVRKVTLVIDRNPSPVAAEFTIGEKAAVTSLATRVRVDGYTDIHAVAETADGSLYVAKVFVKASGGCSAPAGKDPDEALANLGKMKLRQFPAQSDRREVQLMIRHPNNSGLQMDQVTRHYVPLYIVRDLKISQGGDLLLRVEGGISISEDPNFRFDFAGNGQGKISVEAIDTSDRTFTGEWPLTPGGSDS